MHNLVFVLNVYVMPLVLPFFIFMHLHLASHLGMLDEPCEGCDAGAEPEDGVWWTYPEGGRTGQVHIISSSCVMLGVVVFHLRDSVWYPRQALEHSKPPMFLQIS